jgi:hypothetical protein
MTPIGTPLTVVPSAISVHVAQRHPVMSAAVASPDRSALAGCPSGQRERSVKPPAQPTLVRTQHPPQPPAGPGFWGLRSVFRGLCGIPSKCGQVPLEAPKCSPMSKVAGHTRDKIRVKATLIFVPTLSFYGLGAPTRIHSLGTGRGLPLRSSGQSSSVSPARSIGPTATDRLTSPASMRRLARSSVPSMQEAYTRSSTSTP